MVIIIIMVINTRSLFLVVGLVKLNVNRIWYHNGNVTVTL